jgi:hypothetical protein
MGAEGDYHARVSVQPDDIPQMLREPQERGLRTAAEGLLQTYRVSCQHALDWQRKAGRVLAEKGLETDVLRQRVERWIEREWRQLRDALVELLARTGV